jgi:ADP-ribose pyrophosphatase YjhB (NUDIX family)
LDLSKSKCPKCGHEWRLRNPLPTVDIIIELEGETPPRIVLVSRKIHPPGWALPGGFVEYGETVEEAAVREAREETGLDISLIRQFHVYSEPSRDPRGHMMSTVFLARARGMPVGADDAKEARGFDPNDLPEDMAFDHRDVIADYLGGKY